MKVTVPVTSFTHPYRRLTVRTTLASDFRSQFRQLMEQAESRLQVLHHVLPLEGETSCLPASAENRNVRKRIVSSSDRTNARPSSGAQWMELGQIATVEFTSEDPAFPIESVFSTDGSPGWRASQKGEQQIRLIFDQAMPVRRIQLHFLEPTQARLQEFVNGGRRPAQRDRPPAVEFQSYGFDQRARRL